MNKIILGRGFDKIEFGMTREEVIKTLGEPDEIEQFASSDEPNDNTEAYHYDEYEMSITFDELFDWRLSSITTSSPDSEIEGIKFIGVSDNEAIAKLSQLDLGEMEREDIADPDYPDTELIAYPDASINFWVINGMIEEIQFGPFIEDEE